MSVLFDAPWALVGIPKPSALRCWGAQERSL
jgi:hypothetical protein